MKSEQLKAEFESLSDEEKANFIRLIIPSLCTGWMAN